MLQFLKSSKFKTFIFVIAALLVGAIIAIATQGSSSPITDAVGTVFMPLQKATAFISEKVNWFEDSFASAGSYKKEVERLQQKIAEYESQLADYNDIQHKLESYETMLGVKENNPDFTLQRASVIGTDSADMFTSLIIDKGSNDDVSENDPVVSGNYVVGIVKKVHPSYSVVESILNPDVNISAIESKTRETAYLTTTIEHSQNGNCILSGLSRTTSVTPGGLILTSGIGGTYPKGLIIGTVSEVVESKYDLSSYAVVEPGVDVREIEDLFIITDFAGQGVEEIVE
ncbi:MAG: rod shape-determining protein MreC [Clostridia bacterium]|nr:rod shape-determining protein MreC [Clostridia bacterium]